jgi:hypothetical protein
MSLAGANPVLQVKGLDELPGKSNYLKGNDRAGWQRNVPNYAKVRYEQIYAGVDMLYYGNQQQLEYDFIVAPGADPKAIEIAYQGADNLDVDKDGNLVLQVKSISLTQQAPVAYQETDGVRQTIAASYVLKDNRRVGFELGEYDTSKPLVIDPLLVYSTYLGGSIPGPEQIGDFAAGVAVDASGNAFVVGTTDSEDFPMVAVADPYQEKHRNDTCSVGDIDFLRCGDVFVTKFNSVGSQMLYSTFIGSDHDDQAFGIALDAGGHAYITGGTDPFSVFGTIKHWPLTSNAFQRDAQFDARDASDAFVTVLNTTGTDLIYSTYYGGNNIDIAHAISIGPQGFAYITGETDSTRFITMRNAFQNDKKGDDSNRNQHRDAFVAVFNPFETKDDDTLVYATYFGGLGTADIGNGIAVDVDGNAHVVGQTNSSDFPIKANSASNPAFQPNSGGGTDAWLAKFNTNSSGSASLIQSTYFGGTSTDVGLAVAVDSTKRIYFTGRTSSSATTFPLLNAFDSTQAGGEAFVAKMGIFGDALFYSSFMGGSSAEEGRAIAVDAVGNAYIAGKTNSTNFPVKNAFQVTKNVANDAFVAKISASASPNFPPSLLWSSFLGGNDNDAANGIFVDAKTNVYVAGETESPLGFPILGPDGAFQSSLRGNNDAFVTKIGETRPDTIGVFHPPSQFQLRNTNSPGAADITVPFGQNGDLPLAGDWDNNGIDDVGVFRPSAGQFLLRQPGFTLVCNPFCIPQFAVKTITINFGQAGDLPIAGDWDGDGVDTVGVFRPSNNTFFLTNSNDTNPPIEITTVVGAAEDLPLAGDWDGNGVDGIGLFRPSITKFFLSNNNAVFQNDIVAIFGLSADLPLAGDWDGDGDDNIGTFRPSSASFSLSNDNSAVSLSFIFGVPGDQPVAGDWDGKP